MGDAGGQLAERGKFLGLHQAILRGAQVFQGFRQFAGTRLDVFEQPRILNRQCRLGRESLDNVDDILREGSRCPSADNKQPDDVLAAQERRRQPRAEPGAQDDVVDGVGTSACKSATWIGSRCPNTVTMLVSSSPIWRFLSSSINSRSMP